MQRREVLLLMTLAAAMPAVAQTVAPAVENTSSIPDFSGIWWHPSLPGLEPLASGPTSLVNRSRRNGVSDYTQLVGDYTNPILQPWAADVVKKHGEQSIAGIVYPNPANQCWPEPIPFIYKNFALQLLQRPHEVTIIYEQDHEVRHVRMNSTHPVKVTPSWYGDSIAHYEGDTLVIDTVGQKRGRYSMLDLYGTPYSESLHVVERFRLVDYEEAKEGIDRDAKENQRPQVGIDRNYRGKHLQLQLTVEDTNVFTTPWSATITYGRGSTEWPEVACAENIRVYYDKDTDVPQAAKPDF